MNRNSLVPRQNYLARKVNTLAWQALQLNRHADGVFAQDTWVGDQDSSGYRVPKVQPELRQGLGSSQSLETR